MSNDTRKLIGVISDTHGLVRPQALDALAGVDLILHAGDIGNRQVLDTRGRRFESSRPDHYALDEQRITLWVVLFVLRGWRRCLAAWTFK